MVAATHPAEDRPLRLTFVLWSGQIGGAESFTIELAAAMQRLGAEPTVVFVLDGLPLSARLDELAIPTYALGLPRGRAVVRARHRLARVAAAHDPDAAILVGSGYLAASLRRGGFSGPIIGTEHGYLLQLGSLKRRKRWIRTVDRLSGMGACSALVAVSDYMRDRAAATRFAPPVVCIPNGIDLLRFSPAGTSRRAHDDLVIGCASRLIEGKGVDDAIAALAHPSLERAHLRIAGAGSLEAILGELSRSLGVDSRVEFAGRVLDMPAFWRSVDVAVVPSNQWIESFGMVALEAMACARPVVATRNGALPSLVEDGRTGTVVARGDVDALAGALAAYARDPALCARHGRAGRDRCEEQFSIERTALRYVQLCVELITATTPGEPHIALLDER